MKIYICDMDKIPVSFEYASNRYNGYLSPVSGASKTLYHLMIDNYYRGQLFRNDHGWRFTSQDGTFEELTDYFVQTVNASASLVPCQSFGL